MSKSFLAHVLCTLGYIGYLPGGGTWATLCFLPCAWYIRSALSWELYTLTVIGMTVCAYYLIKQQLPSYGSGDPHEIVIDECIGVLYALCIPLHIGTIITACIVFRVLDITKSFYIYKLESIPGAIGVLLDDIAAGILSAFFVYGLHVARVL